MKNKLLKRILNVGLVVILCILALPCAGCRHRNKVTRYNAESVLKEMLEEKYGMEFEVSDAKGAFVPSGLPGCMANTFCAEAYCKETGQSCYALIDKDGSNFKDEYCKTFLQEPLEAYVYDLVAEIENVEVTEYHAVFLADAGHWNEQSRIEDYLSSADTYACLTVKVGAADLDEAVELCYRVYKELDENNTRPNITFVYGEKTFHICSPYKNNEKDEITEKIRRELSE